MAFAFEKRGVGFGAFELLRAFTHASGGTKAVSAAYPMKKAYSTP